MTEFNVAIIGTGVLLAIGLLAAAHAWRQKRKPIDSISPKEILEALIPAIADIEHGYYENICYFISDANKGLERLGSPYRFESTSKVRRSWDVTGAFVDKITVIEIEKNGIKGGSL